METALPLVELMVRLFTGGSTSVYSGPRPCFAEPAFTQYESMRKPSGAVMVTVCGSPVVSFFPESRPAHTCPGSGLASAPGAATVSPSAANRTAPAVTDATRRVRRPMLTVYSM